jgi:hypothetical protein
MTDIGTICVDGYKHRRIRRIFGCLSPKYTDYDWKQVYILYGTVCFLVWYTEQHPEFNLVIRPAKQYYKIEFEQLFRFDFKNKGYREDRMIGLYKKVK